MMKFQSGRPNQPRTATSFRIWLSVALIVTALGLGAVTPFSERHAPRLEPATTTFEERPSEKLQSDQTGSERTAPPLNEFALKNYTATYLQLQGERETIKKQLANREMEIADYLKAEEALLDQLEAALFRLQRPSF